jgi:hypothetical protein
MSNAVMKISAVSCIAMFVLAMASVFIVRSKILCARRS